MKSTRTTRPWKRSQIGLIATILLTGALLLTMSIWSTNVNFRSTTRNLSSNSTSRPCAEIVDHLNNKKYWMIKYSQNVQDGLLQYLFQVLNTTNKFYVEFGFGYSGAINDGVYYGMGLNTAYLRTQNWTGVYFDAILENAKYGVVKAILTRENIVQSFKNAGVPYDVDYVSIDVDSVDLWLFKALIEDGSPYRPRVITVEFNANYPKDVSVTMGPKWHEWTRRSVYGASAAALNTVATMHGYTTVHVMPSGLDMFFVRTDLLRQVCHHMPSFSDVFPDSLPKKTLPNCVKADLERWFHYPTLLKNPNDFDAARKIAYSKMRSVEKRYGYRICDPE